MKIRTLLVGFWLTLLTTLPVHAQQDGPPGTWRQIDSLNAGLPQPEEQIRHASPRELLETFLDLTEHRQFADAAHLLNLNQLSDEDQRRLGPVLSAQLASVIERQVWISWPQFSARPDALVEAASGDHPLAGQPRRDVEVDAFEVDNRARDIRIERVRVSDTDPVWVFTERTVVNTPALFDAYGPRWFEDYLPNQLDNKILGLKLWEWIGLPIILLLAGIVGWLIYKSCSRVGSSIHEGVVSWLFSRAAVPLAIVGGAATIQILLGNFVSLSGPSNTIIQPALIIAMVTGVALAILRAIDGVLDKITERYVGEIDDAESSDERKLYTSIYAVRRIVVLITVAIAIGLVLMEMNLFATLGLSLLASAGVVTVVLGIAGQTVLGNILASLQIALAKPVRIGDAIHYEGDWAYVEAIFYTFIRLRTWDDRRLVVPVQYFVSHPFENWSMQDARMVRTFTLLLDHMADVDVLRQEFQRVASADEDVIEEGKIKTLVLGHREAGQEITFYAMAADPSTAWDMHARLRETMIRFVRENHPDWWPRERVAEMEDTKGKSMQGFG
ncbi:mechanosensitive ion channel family protein [Pontivivens insulae]|uniref:mechanosensitive ion channel family protein n=1 Tax=Pontivivens insulae TaxID=1639689 RepID=UPI0013C2DC86|nr:mechanosensitive ion channel domain-containing protein [Pontivivens insulae]